MRQPVVVYTQSCCAACDHVMEYLQQHGVDFEAKDVSADSAAMQELVDRGYMTTPVTFVGDSVVAGFDRKKLEALLEAAGHA